MEIDQESPTTETETEIYIKKPEQLALIFAYDVRHIFRLLKSEGAPQKTESGYPLKAWVAYVIERKAPQGKNPNKAQLEEENIRLKHEKANIAEFHRKVLEKELVNRKEYEEAERSRLIEYRQAMRGLGAKISAKCAFKSAAEVRDIFDNEFRLLSNNFVAKIRRRQEKMKNKKGAGRPSVMEAIKRKARKA